MSTDHSPADDLVYDLVSIQYHALKGAELIERFRRDAEGHDDVVSFLDRVADEDARRAQDCHRLLRMLTRDHGIAGGSVEDHQPGMGQGSFPMGSDDDGLAAGATSTGARAGDVTGGGTTTGISASAADEVSAPAPAPDGAGRRATGGEGEGSGGAEGASGDAADATGYLEAQAPAASTVDDVEGAAANATSGAATTDEPGSVDLRGTSDPAVPRT
jgi:hypothetical protein